MPGPLAYFDHVVRSIMQGFKPLNRRQFYFRVEICMMARQM